MKSDVISEETFDTKLITTTQVSQVLPHTPWNFWAFTPYLNHLRNLKSLYFSPYSCFVLKNNMYLCRSTENIKY